MTPMNSGRIAGMVLLCCAIFAAVGILEKGAGAAEEKSAPKVTVTSELDHQLTLAEKEFVSAAEAMPEEKYSFAPASGEFKGVRTFAGQVRHVAFVNFLFFNAVLGEERPEGVGNEGPQSVKTKDQLLRYLLESFAAGHRAIAAMKPGTMVTPVSKPPNPRYTTPLAVTFHAVAHAYNHYGQMVEYLRMNGIVPPATVARNAASAQ